MKKIFCLYCILPVFLLILSGCKSQTDYYSYISELRYGVFLYSGDTDEIKIYCSEREVPYAADGIKGEMNGLTEIYASFGNSYSSVTIDINGDGGEMSYMTVKNCWYLSFSGNGYDCDSLEVTFTLDGKETGYTLLNVLGDGVMDGKSALGCVIEYNPDLFAQNTSGGIFCGEIYIRLLYDGKCYYYVGVTDRSGNTQAYLTDGESGRVIAEHYTAG